MGRNRALCDDGLLRNLDARLFGVSDRPLLQVVPTKRESLSWLAFVQSVNLWASQPRLLTSDTDDEDP